MLKVYKQIEFYKHVLIFIICIGYAATCDFVRR